MPTQTNPPASASSTTWNAPANVVKSSANQQFADSATAGTASNDLAIGFGGFSVADGSTAVALAVPTIVAQQRANTTDSVNVYVSTDGTAKNWGPFAAANWPSGNGISGQDASVAAPTLSTTGLTPAQCRAGLFLILELPTGANGAVGLDFVSLEASWTGATETGSTFPPQAEMKRIGFGVREL